MEHGSAVRDVLCVTLLALAVVSPLSPAAEPAGELPELGDVSGEDWMTHRRGIEGLDADFVLPPFEPVRATADGSASVWGRRYQVGSSGLLSQADIRGKPFLAAPMEFRIDVAGKPIVWAPQVFTLLASHRGRAEYLARGSSAQAELEARTTIEFDGMVRVDLTIRPKGCVELTGFSYRIVYPEEKAVLLRYDGAKFSGLSANVPFHSYSRTVPDGRGVVWEAPFKTLVWMGDVESGFLWFCASEQHWSPQERAERPNALTIERTTRGVELVVSPVTEPYVLCKPATYTFGFFATPVRPFPKGWRSWTQTYWQHKRGRILYYSSPSWDVVPFYPRIRDAAAYRGAVDEARRDGKELMPYLDPTLMTLGILRDVEATLPQTWQLPDMAFDRDGVGKDSDFAWQVPELKYLDAWKSEPQMILAYGKDKGYRQVRMGIASAWSDFYCYLVEQHARAGCRGSADLDEWMVTFDMNPRHGAGYVDQHGVRRYNYDTFAKRDLLKRICAVFLAEHGEPPLIIAHTAATVGIPIVSFATALLTGENINTGYFVESSNEIFFDAYFRNREALEQCLEDGGRNWYYYAAPVDRWQGECLGRQFGFPMVVMANLWKSRHMDETYRKSVRATRDFMSMVVIHDNLSWPVFCDRATVYEYWSAREAFGIADEGVAFFPYWEKPCAVADGSPDVRVSAYRNGDKWLFCISNLALEDWSGSITVDPAVFGKAQFTQVTNAASKQPVAVSGPRFPLAIAARDYALLFAE